MRWVLFISGALLGGAASALANNQEGLYGSEELGRPPIAGEDSISMRLSARAADLEVREKAFEVQVADLKAEEERVRAELARNEAVRDEIRELIESLDERHSEQLLSQIKVFEKMRGAQAAAVLSATDEPTALAIIQGMRPDKAAKIIGAMAPNKAATLTEKLTDHPMTGMKLP